MISTPSTRTVCVRKNVKVSATGLLALSIAGSVGVAICHQTAPNTLQKAPRSALSVVQLIPPRLAVETGRTSVSTMIRPSTRRIAKRSHVVALHPLRRCRARRLDHRHCQPQHPVPQLQHQ